MGDGADTPAGEKSYLPAEASLLATSVACLAIAVLAGFFAATHH